MTDIPYVYYFQGEKLSECSHGKLINALRFAKEYAFSDFEKYDRFLSAVTEEALSRGILPDAMWLISGPAIIAADPGHSGVEMSRQLYPDKNVRIAHRSRPNDEHPDLELRIGA